MQSDTGHAQMDKREIFEIIIGHAREVVPSLAEHEFQMSDALKELGASSLDRSEITMMTLETLSLRTPLIDLVKANNLGELVDLLHARHQRP